MKFDVHHAGAIGGTPIGPFIRTIEAPDHRHAKQLGEESHPGIRVIVLPHRPPSEKLERALRAIERTEEPPMKPVHELSNAEIVAEARRHQSPTPAECVSSRTEVPAHDQP